ncbi:YeeE/YedE family protein [Corynebacterium incognita]|uniref:YeeE/YedE family protein n=1 Tax=Corynebacterium incognita TaxID=2754725 RepID=A0A7G7CQY3_9CORY|nr:YeeE/YedE family protein [Corynebacterium incognita]
MVAGIWGGVLMGIGAAWAGGCTVGNGMVETSLFTFPGWIALLFFAFGVFAGAKLWLKPAPRPPTPSPPGPPTTATPSPTSSARTTPAGTSRW